METRESSHLAALIRKVNKTIFTHCIEKKCDQTSFENEIREKQGKKGGIFNKNRRTKIGNRYNGYYA